MRNPHDQRGLRMGARDPERCVRNAGGDLDLERSVALETRAAGARRRAVHGQAEYVTIAKDPMQRTRVCALAVLLIEIQVHRAGQV